MSLQTVLRRDGGLLAEKAAETGDLCLLPAPLGTGGSVLARVNAAWGEGRAPCCTSLGLPFAVGFVCFCLLRLPINHCQSISEDDR